MLTEGEKTDVLEEFKEEIVLLQGIFPFKFFDQLKQENKKDIFVLEGRPSLKAAEFCCKQLVNRKIKPTLIADNMAGFMFFKKLVKEIWVSYHSIDKDGILTQIGGLILGVLAYRHKVPIYASAGEKNLVLLGHEKEIFYFNGMKVAPSGIKGYVPLAEWVPRKYITKIYE